MNYQTFLEGSYTTNFSKSRKLDHYKVLGRRSRERREFVRNLR